VENETKRVETMPKRRRLPWLLLGLALAFVGAQFVPVERTNPRVTGDLTAPSEIATMLRTSCYDCHSNETVWPWYAYVAPFAWSVEGHVREGRRRLNFSNWQELPDRRKLRLVEEMREEIDASRMPMPSYVMIHREAALTLDQKAALYQWIEQEAGRHADPSPPPQPTDSIDVDGD